MHSQSADLLARAKVLLDTSNARAAFELLESQTDRLAGDPNFDYLLGIAALDAGRPGVAVLALERVLIANPNHLQARAEIARAYFELGETKTAQAEFQAVKGQSLPPQVAATIDKFLDAIDKRLADDETHVRGYVEAGLGLDSNLNTATGSSQIALPLFGGAVFAMNAAGTRQTGSFTTLGTGINVSTPLRKDLRLLAGVSAALRTNGSKDSFDTLSYEGNVGLAWRRDEKNLFSLGFQAQEFDLDNRRFRTALGLSGQWQHTLAEDKQVSVFGQYTDLSYPGQDLRNADRLVAGAGYVQAFSLPWSPVGFVTAFTAREQERAPNATFLGHVAYGLRAGVSARPAPDWTVNLNLSSETRHYGGTEPLFLTGRVDRQTDARLAVDYTVQKNLTASAYASYTDNASNIVLNKFDRRVVGINLRMEF